MIKIIVAIDKNNLIGNNDSLPWVNKDDLKHFRKETKNNYLVIGKNTFLGLKNNIKNKKIIVLSETKNLDKSINNYFKIYNNIEKLINDFKNEVIYICGGAKIYKQFLPLCNELIITIINKEYKGNIYFPNWNKNNFILYKIKILNNYTKVFYFKMAGVTGIEPTTV